MDNDMKVELTPILVGALLCIGADGCASHKQQQSGTNGQYAPGDRDRYEYVTGSYIPQNVQKNGPVSNGKDNLRIIDRTEIDRSGGADLEETLRRLGANH